MDVNMPVTLTIVAAIIAMFIFATIKAKQPAEPLKVRMVDYHVVQIFCIVGLLIMGAHLMTLFFGHPITAQQGGGGRPF